MEDFSKVPTTAIMITTIMVTKRVPLCVLKHQVVLQRMKTRPNICYHKERYNYPRRFFFEHQICTVHGAQSHFVPGRSSPRRRACFTVDGGGGRVKYEPSQTESRRRRTGPTPWSPPLDFPAQGASEDLDGEAELSVRLRD